MKKNSILIFICCFSILLGERSDKTMFEDCSNAPNCVSSESKNTKYFIEPIIINSENKDIKNKLIETILKLNGKILENHDNYLKVAFYSKVFNFEDVAEFRIDYDKNIINIKSKAQTGWYDFGVNRKRMEKIRAALK
ncbi:MAG: DUF1499 domain-containing protein [Cetobacterium sp.]